MEVTLYRLLPRHSLFRIAQLEAGTERPPAFYACKALTLFMKLAGGLGFEPRQAESESAVLPLDDPPTERFV